MRFKSFEDLYTYRDKCFSCEKELKIEQHPLDINFQRTLHHEELKQNGQLKLIFMAEVKIDTKSGKIVDTKIENKINFSMYCSSMYCSKYSYIRHAHYLDFDAIINQSNFVEIVLNSEKFSVYENDDEYAMYFKYDGSKKYLSVSRNEQTLISELPYDKYVNKKDITLESIKKLLLMT